MDKGVKIQLEIGREWVQPEVHIRAAEEQVGARIARCFDTYQEEQLVIKVKDASVFVTKADIVYIEIFNKIVTLYTENEVYSFRRSLAALKEELPSGQFLQVSKSALGQHEGDSKARGRFFGELVCVSKEWTKNHGLPEICRAIEAASRNE